MLRTSFSNGNSPDPTYTVYRPSGNEELVSRLTFHSLSSLDCHTVMQTDRREVIREWNGLENNKTHFHNGMFSALRLSDSILVSIHREVFIRLVCSRMTLALLHWKCLKHSVFLMCVIFLSSQPKQTMDKSPLVPCQITCVAILASVNWKHHYP